MARALQLDMLGVCFPCYMVFAQCIHDLSLFRGPVALGPVAWPSGLPLWSAVYSEPGMKTRFVPIVGRARDCPLFSSFLVLV